MYYAAESNIKSPLYNRNRKLKRTDGIFPTTTMLLHERIVGWHRKRRIPVRDADKSSSLNSYLIDPKYLENGEVTLPEQPRDTEKVDPHIPVHQYSKLTRTFEHNSPNLSGPLRNTTRRITAALAAGMAALTAEVSTRYRSLISPKPTTHYAVDKGVLPWWRHRLKVFGTALLTGGLIVAAATISPSPTSKPTPVSANPASSSSQKISTNDVAHASSIPSPNNGQQNSSGTSASSTQVSTSNQQSVSTSAGQVINNSLVGGSGGSTPTVTTPPITSNPDPVTIPPTQPLDPIVSPVIDVVNNVLSTQVSVNVPSLTTTQTQPLVEISQ